MTIRVNPDEKSSTVSRDTKKADNQLTIKYSHLTDTDKKFGFGKEIELLKVVKNPLDKIFRL